MAHENPNEVVASNIRTLRQNQGLSQERLAELSDLHRTYIGAIERGERNVTLDTLAQIANALGVPCAELLTPLRRKGSK